ncbi:16443_t:CDS:2, partial [Cetraspora pellucida]
MEKQLWKHTKELMMSLKLLLKKTNSRIDMRKSGNYTLTTIKFFKETTLAPQKSEKISEQESAWIDLATTGALIFAERYEAEANQYNVNSMYIFEMIKKDTSWPIAPATIEGNPSKKSLQLTVMNISPNTLIYKRNVRITGKDMFGEWGNILYKIKKEDGIEGKVSKALLVSLWDALCEQRNGQNYDLHPRIKPFLLAFARKRILEIVKPLGDQVKRIYTDGFIIAGKVELKTGIEMKPSYSEIPNLIIFKENELRSTNSLPDFEKIQQDKKQNTILDTEYPVSQIAKRKLSKKSDINLPNEIIIEIFQYLRTQNKRLC